MVVGDLSIHGQETSQSLFSRLWKKGVVLGQGFHPIPSRNDYIKLYRLSPAVAVHGCKPSTCKLG